MHSTPCPFLDSCTPCPPPCSLHSYLLFLSLQTQHAPPPSSPPPLFLPIPSPVGSLSLDVSFSLPLIFSFPIYAMVIACRVCMAYYVHTSLAPQILFPYDFIYPGTLFLLPLLLAIPFLPSPRDASLHLSSSFFPSFILSIPPVSSPLHSSLSISCLRFSLLTCSHHLFSLLLRFKLFLFLLFFSLNLISPSIRPSQSSTTT